MKEKIIKDYEDYSVNTLGQIWSFKTNKYLKHNFRGGYPSVTLYNDTMKKRHTIHRLVTEYFIPNPLNKRTVNHINGIKDDNRIENLEWATDQENISHGYQLGLYKLCCENPRSKHTKSEHSLIMYLHTHEYSANQIINTLNLKMSQGGLNGLIKKIKENPLEIKAEGDSDW